MPRGRGGAGSRVSRRGLGGGPARSPPQLARPISELKKSRLTLLGHGKLRTSERETLPGGLEKGLRRAGEPGSPTALGTRGEREPHKSRNTPHTNAPVNFT
ncbi:hypothetical protein SKAU_G00162990 [Synaphobranchus kaupii]|uniref:Uncharacterized protein n=1 Tax=Synaphobranchus kaupii TaxID=118154 RepID=A0A9Q1IXU9_SYNKA|nr:hypothetical protein SKAU_G00162990 [Synaphobranchus kaupii]